MTRQPVLRALSENPSLDSLFFMQLVGTRHSRAPQNNKTLGRFSSSCQLQTGVRATKGKQDQRAPRVHFAYRIAAISGCFPKGNWTPFSVVVVVVTRGQCVCVCVRACVRVLCV